VEFDLTRWLEDTLPERKEAAFVRLCVTDAAGHKAFTRPYYQTELFED